MALAWRTAAYSGVMSARLAEQDQGQERTQETWGGYDVPTTRDVPLGASTEALVDAEGGSLSDLFD